MGYGRNEPGPPAIVSTIADTGNLPDVRFAPEPDVPKRPRMNPKRTEGGNLGHFLVGFRCAGRLARIP
jgi:hypothetical protein